MIKLLLGRLLPMAAAIGLFASALSPLRPALKAFGVAANALAGEGGAPGLGSGLSWGGDDGETPHQHLASQRRLAEMASKLRGEGPKLKQYNAPDPERSRHKRKRAPRAAPMPPRPFTGEISRARETAPQAAASYDSVASNKARWRSRFTHLIIRDADRRKRSGDKLHPKRGLSKLNTIR